MRLPIIDKYLIDREFQLSYVLHGLLLLLFVTISMVVVLFMWNQSKFYRHYLLYPPDADKVVVWANEHKVKLDSMEFAYQFIAQAKPYSFYQIIIFPAVIIFAVNIVVIILLSLYISYRIAVPLRALKVAMRKKVETGRFDKPLSVKEGDPFHELTSLANLLLFVASNPGVKHFTNAGEAEPEKDAGKK